MASSTSPTVHDFTCYEPCVPVIPVYERYDGKIGKFMGCTNDFSIFRRAELVPCAGTALSFVITDEEFLSGDFWMEDQREGQRTREASSDEEDVSTV